MSELTEKVSRIVEYWRDTYATQPSLGGYWPARTQNTPDSQRGGA